MTNEEKTLEYQDRFKPLLDKYIDEVSGLLADADMTGLQFLTDSITEIMTRTWSIIDKQKRNAIKSQWDVN